MNAMKYVLVHTICLTILRWESCSAIVATTQPEVEKELGKTISSCMLVLLKKNCIYTSVRKKDSLSLTLLDFF